MLFIILIAAFSCSKKNSTPVETPPTNLTVSAVVNQDSSGTVTFTSVANNAVSYDYDFGNGIYQTVPTGVVTYKYPSSGTYTVNVTAKSPGGLTISKSIQVAIGVAVSLIWSDEFNTPGAPDPSKWGYDLGGGGWGNNELENYTNRLSNAVVSNGTLKITALKENYGGNAYTSARLLTKDKFSFKYGKIEVRAKLPGVAGNWPAIWMLGANITSVGWPASGEMDIMEQKGSIPDKIFGTLHYPGHFGGNGDGSSTTITNATGDFHRYAEEWTPSTIKFMVDDVVFYTFNNKISTPFNLNFFIILNLAVGGNFGGAVDPNFSTATMEVDYVRVYQ